MYQKVGEEQEKVDRCPNKYGNKQKEADVPISTEKSRRRQISQ